MKLKSMYKFSILCTYVCNKQMTCIQNINNIIDQRLRIRVKSDCFVYLWHYFYKVPLNRQNTKYAPVWIIIVYLPSVCQLTVGYSGWKINKTNMHLGDAKSMHIYFGFSPTVNWQHLSLVHRVVCHESLTTKTKQNNWCHIRLDS